MFTSPGRAALLVALALLAASARASAQNTLLDHARRAVHDAADAGKKGVTDEANKQVSGAVENVATQDVADGSFAVALSPWSSSDNSKRVELARYNGQAYEATTAAGRQIVLCDNVGTVPWQVTFTIASKPATPASAATATGARGATTPARGAAPATATKSASTTTGGGTTGASGGGGSSSAPSAGETDYPFPSTAVTLTLPAVGARSGVPGGGGLRVAELSQTIYAGVGKVRFLKATIPGDKTPDVVDLGVSFKARVLAANQAAGGCAAIARLNLPPLPKGSSDSSKSKVATAAGGAAPATTPSTPAAGVTAAPGAAAPVGPTFTAGDVLLSKIDQVKLLAEAKDSAKVTTTLKKTDELVYLGDEQNGYIHVQGSTGEGWVRKVLVIKRP